MQIGIIGGSGFLGKNLTLYILEHTDWYVKIIARKITSLDLPKQYVHRVTYVVGDVLNKKSIQSALSDVDVAYYFVHMMGHKDGDFYSQELKAAHLFKEVVGHSKIRRLIYMGGLGNDKDKLSKHLASRHRTGHILRSLRSEVIEFQASMIIGTGSVGFDIIANLVDKLPIMFLPKSASTLTQPIVLADALNYLYQAAHVKITHNEVVQIGGPDVLSYQDIYQMYANHIAKHRIVVRVPFVPAWIEAKFLDSFTPTVHARIGRAMVESLDNEMIVTSHRAAELFPLISPRPIEATLARLS